MDKPYHPTWKPQEDIVIVLSDETAEPRSVEQINALFDALRAAANEHDFDLSCWGGRKAIAGYLTT